MYEKIIEALDNELLVNKINERSMKHAQINEIKKYVNETNKLIEDLKSISIQCINI